MEQTLKTNIVDIIRRTPDVMSFRLDGKGRVAYDAGQFMNVSFDGSKEFSRWLSFSSSPTEKGFFEFTKKITQSPFSARLSQAKVGDQLIIRYPFGKFVYRRGEGKLAFLSGGIGITPIRGIARYLSDIGSSVEVIILYGNRSEETIAFRDDLDRMQLQNARLKVVHILSHPVAGWQGRTGRIDGRVITEEIPDVKDRLFYLCGPPQMVEGLQKVLTGELALSADRIVTEHFTGY